MRIVMSTAVFAALALSGCAQPAAPQAAVTTPRQAVAHAAAPPYSQLLPSESSMKVVQTRNSLPVGAE